MHAGLTLQRCRPGEGQQRCQRRHEAHRDHAMRLQNLYEAVSEKVRGRA